ncbi:MAG: TonB-dependent receptor, partial [Maribacter sp.]|nr:TonB-dependent receptor [Maribacter sp.]
MTKAFSIILFFTILFICSPSWAQFSVNGEITDDQGEPLVGAHVLVTPVNRFATSNIQGRFKVTDLSSGQYLVSVSYLGFKTYSGDLKIEEEDIELNIILENDPLALQSVVVTGTFEPRSKLSSSTAITTLGSRALQQAFPRGAANLLQSIPGTFTDPSAGEVFTRVYARGISASAEDDMGWYYVSLQEDGLPVSLVQHSYYGPDIFHRMDITTERIEAIRGGSAAITSLNGPGGIYNFISNGPRDIFGGEIRLQGGLQGESNSLLRIDGTLGGPLGNNWFYTIGGHYRKDDGARNTDFNFSKGGQLKFNVLKRHSKGYIK